MNRENKRKTFEKDYYKSHPCHDSFTCRVCGRLCTPENAGSDHRNHCPNCLSSLHVDVTPGDRASDCGGIMEPVGGLGASGRRMGTDSSLSALRRALFQSGGRRRQSDETDEHCAETVDAAAFSAGAHRGDDRSHGRRGKHQVVFSHPRVARLAARPAFFGVAFVNDPEEQLPVFNSSLFWKVWRHWR